MLKWLEMLWEGRSLKSRMERHLKSPEGQRQLVAIRALWEKRRCPKCGRDQHSGTDVPSGDGGVKTICNYDGHTMSVVIEDGL